MVQGAVKLCQNPGIREHLMIQGAVNLCQNPGIRDHLMVIGELKFISHSPGKKTPLGLTCTKKTP